uniref:Uncharacterized protein n=1 Tax=Tanacetum cinerariifolium TaxID=118510 RepID=A0A699JV90_TANCI|nr:hypothetical protein [Tanacetum cinerariifolium]
MLLVVKNIVERFRCSKAARTGLRDATVQESMQKLTMPCCAVGRECDPDVCRNCEQDAISRITGKKGFRVFLCDEDGRQKTITTNVVYNEALQMTYSI